MNLSATGCLSGTGGSIPFEIVGVPGEFRNAVLRMTISEAGFSNGLLGVTVDSDAAFAVAEALLPDSGTLVEQLLDIRSDLTNKSDVACDALSGSYRIGGVTVVAPATER